MAELVDAHPVSVLTIACPPAADESAVRDQSPLRFVASDAYKTMSDAAAWARSLHATASTTINETQIDNRTDRRFDIRTPWKSWLDLFRRLAQTKDQNRQRVELERLQLTDEDASESPGPTFELSGFVTSTRR